LTQSIPTTSSQIVFKSEAELVGEFVSVLRRRATPWGRLQLLTEWDYRSGITDVLARTPQNELIAFEAKLTNWRRAVFQAYRNTSFAARAYVVLPERVARRVSLDDGIFARYGVGLCTCSNRQLSVLIEARTSEPLMDWMTKRAQAAFDRISNGHPERSGGRCGPTLRTA
jgi:hypothetical protein